MNRLSTRRAGRFQGIGEGGSHQEGTSQALTEARTAHPGGRRAYVARRRCDSLRARIQRAVWGVSIGLPIALSCEEVSQPGGCIHLAKRSDWRRRVSTQHIRPRWQAGHTAPASSCTGAALVSGGTAGGALTCCWSHTRHPPSFAWRTRLASNPSCRIRWKPAGKIWGSVAKLLFRDFGSL